jgi:calcineurin-like phosphoesterase family protein
MKIWLTTDTHFSHTTLIKYGRVPNFENRIKENLKRLVSSEDLLIHLGDICIGNDIINNNWFKKELECRTYLLRGNHDNKSIGWYLKNGWDAVADRLDIKMFGKTICFTHIPVAWDGYFDVNYHGHFHDTDHRRSEPEFNKILSGYNELIALENNNYMPVLLKTKIETNHPEHNIDKV